MAPKSVDLMVERLESLKAGVLASFCVCLAMTFASIVNSLVHALYFESAVMQIDPLNWHSLVRGVIAAFSGLLFGVTYRYIIRSDKNLQLKAGGVLAFGLVRGLAQVDVGLYYANNVVLFVILGLESVLLFSFAAIAIDTAMQLGWIKPFPSSESE